MSDELVKRLRANTSWGDDRFAEAADRIEALTAKVAELEACLERQGSGHREDLDEIANVSVERLRRAKAAEASLLMLLVALKWLMAHEPDYSDTLWQNAHEVLNGETT